MADSQLDIIIRATDKASGTLKKIDRNLGSLEKNTAKFSRALGSSLRIAAGVGAAAVTALGVAVGKAVSASAEMEAQVSGIAAVLGKTKEEIAPLNDLITQLGLDPTLKVNATEAADAIQMLARNGLDMAQIMDGAARNTVLLANATGAEFGTAADIATDIMAQFGIEAANMGEVVNGISGVVNNSKFSVDDYRLAIAQAGGVASSVGVEFDDFNAVIATISPLFASGSDAGTAFKTFLQRLVPQTKSAADSMRDLGLFSGLTTEEFAKVQDKIQDQQRALRSLDIDSANYEDRAEAINNKIAELQSQLVAGNNAFFDQNGAMLDMSTIAQTLTDAMSNLSEERRIETLQTIFGTDAMRAAVAMMEAGADGMNDMATALESADAEESAKTRMDNLSGSLEILGGVFETLQLQIGDVFRPAVRKVVDELTRLLTTHGDTIIEWAQKVSDGLTSIIESMPGIAEEINWDIQIYWPQITNNWDRLMVALGIKTAVGGGNIRRTWQEVLTGFVEDTLRGLNNMLEAFADFAEYVREFFDWLKNPMAGAAPSFNFGQFFEGIGLKFEPVRITSPIDDLFGFQFPENNGTANTRSQPATSNNIQVTINATNTDPAKVQQSTTWGVQDALAAAGL